MMTTTKHTRMHWAAGVSACAMLAFWAAPALAQSAEGGEPLVSAQTPPSAPPAGGDAGAGSKEIIVTGSRLATGFAMPTPIKMMSSDELVKVAPASLAESLSKIPALSGSVLSTNSGTGSGVSQTNGQSLLNLRGLGPSRTLVLLDGARMGVTNVVNSVDVNLIPQPLVSRVDVVTGGASASYGSDAVAGAVNFVLNTHFKGFKAEMSGGVTGHGDATNYHFSFAGGTNIGEHARFIAAVDAYGLNGIPYGNNGRGWYDNATGAWSNAVTGARPTTITAANARSATGTYGGVINSVSGCGASAACLALANQQFLAGGVLSPFNTGTNLGQGFTSGGDGAIVTNGLTPDIRRESVFAHLEYDVTPDITLWGQGIWARSWTLNQAQPPVQQTTTDFTIYEGNPYLPSQVASVFAATPGTQSFTLARYDLDLDRSTVRGVSDVKRFALGAKGKLGASWSFDVTAAYQKTLQQLDIRNTIQRNLYAAADAVTNPATGQIVCRSTLAGLDAGCVPLNVFGPNTISAAANKYIMGWNTADIHLNQATFDANVRGDLGEKFNLGAGPISTAAGFSWRRLTADRVVDSLSNVYIDGTGIRGFPTGLQGRYGGYQYYNPSPLSGKVSVTEGYLELGIPILRDKPFFKALSGTLAGRLTDYSQSGLQTMWKTGLNWTVTPAIRLRGTVSADIRAPSVSELFNTATVTQGRNVVPYSTAPTQIRSSGQNVVVGNPNLRPEKARTYTMGIVLTPPTIPRLQVSVDYYKISLKDSILTLSAQNEIDACYAGNQTQCANIKVNGNSITGTSGITAADYVTVTTPAINYAQETTSGIDLEAAYALQAGPGKLSLRASASYLLHAKVQTTCAGAVDLVGDIGSCGSFPRLRAQASANYEIGPFGFFVTERVIGSGVKNKSLVEGVDITSNKVPATWYTDANLTYKFGKVRGVDTEVFLNISNVFDQDPRNTVSVGRSWVEPSDLTLYDALGRRFLFGIRFRK